VTPLPTPPVLATPTALPTPPVLATPTPLPTPTLPVVLGTPTPSLPALGGPAPSPTTIAAAPGGSAGRPGSGAGGGAPSGGAPGGIHLPLMGVVLSTPLDVALLAVLAGLPLLLGIWVLVFGRTWSEARQARRAQIRLAVANELGLRPRELISVSTEALFKLREEAAFDELTGTLRRAAGMAALDREISRARRVKAPLSVVFIDLDGLKQANDKRGHKAGDELLRGLAALLKSGLRGQDLVTRYGGDEFVCVLPDTPAEAARAKLTSIQAEAGRMEIRFSAGVAELERPDDVVSLLARADGEMYDAKARRGEVRQLRPDPGPSGTVLRPDVRT
jgi:diguanylate cyclase (GGDEF)-like protein